MTKRKVIDQINNDSAAIAALSEMADAIYELFAVARPEWIDVFRAEVLEVLTLVATFAEVQTTHERRQRRRYRTPRKSVLD